MPLALHHVGFAVAVLVPAAAATAGLIRLLRPLLVRYALARPNARSLHKAPTPQGGGIAVVAVAIAATLAGGAWLDLTAAQWQSLAHVLAAGAGLAILGGIDDVAPLPAAPRLALQIGLAALAVAGLPAELRLAAGVPLPVERAVLTIALAWFVNLTNFMDGMDWMSVAEVVPVTAALAGFASLGALPPPLGLLALALCGAMLGFAPFNAPVARLFLGDVGSLPIGLLVGYCLIALALQGDFAAAVLLPLYYVADSGLTLARRLARGAPVWQAHREHYYQRAALRGLPVGACIGRVFAVNLVLVGLAFLSHALGGRLAPVLCLAGGAAAVALLLRGFSRARA